MVSIVCTSGDRLTELNNELDGVEDKDFTLISADNLTRL